MLQEVNENNGSPIMWARISEGKIVLPSDEKDPKAKSRINKVGNKVYERPYASLAGWIKTISVEDNKFGETDIRVGIEDDENKAVLTFGLNSSYGRSFLHQIFNVDFTKQVSFNPWMKVTEDGTKRTNLYLNYGKRESVLYKLPEGTPEIKWVETKKGKVIDPVSKAEFDDFLDTKLKELIKTNNLEYNGNSSMSSEEFLDMSKPLTDEEKSQLKKPSTKTDKTQKPEIIEDGGFEDLFDNLD